jgi:manganese/zinc/iron transport system substrate-binding protein
MKRYPFTPFPFFITLLALLLPTLLLPTTASAQANTPSKIAGLKARSLTGPVKVLTTTNFITDLVKQVGGERVEVTGLMGPGVDPHLYKASAGDVRQLQQAEIIFYGGLDLEGKMVELLERQAKAVAVTERLPQQRLRQPAPGMPASMRIDPHVWFDVSLWRETVGVVEAALAKIDPAGASVFKTRAADYRKELAALHLWAKKETAKIPKQNRVLVTAHDAFGYFGAAYDFEVRGVQGMSTASEAGARDIQVLADFIVTRKIRAVFIETSVPKRTIDAVVAAAQAKKWNVIVGGSLYSDSAGAPGTPEGTYVGMVKANVRLIVAGLLGVKP